RYLTIRVSRARLAAMLPPNTPLLGNRLGANPSARRLLIEYLRGTHDIDLSADRRATQVYEEHVLDLVTLALGGQGEAACLAHERGVRAARLSAVLRLIDKRSGDHTLSAIVIAAMLGVTPRYVHLLLEETGRSFSHHLLERRLQTAAALLRDPQRRERRITD